jgi:hypothetical protein
MAMLTKSNADRKTQGTVVLSQPNAAIKVERIRLTDSQRKGLSTNGMAILSSSKK